MAPRNIFPLRTFGDAVARSRAFGNPPGPLMAAMDVWYCEYARRRVKGSCGRGRNADAALCMVLVAVNISQWMKEG